MEEVGHDRAAPSLRRLQACNVCMHTIANGKIEMETGNAVRSFRTWQKV